MNKLLTMLVCAAALAGCNRSPDFYFKRANLQLSTGKEIQAIEDYNRAILLRRNFPEALTARGMVYERQGDKQKAAMDYKKAIELNTSYLPAYNNMAALLMDAGNYKEAVDMLSQALSVKPEYSYALLNRGLSYYKIGDCASAKADLTRALGFNSKFELAYYHRALCERKEQDITSALGDLDSVLALNPAAGMAWLERGRIKYGMRDYAGAAQDFSKAAELSKTDAAAAYWLAMAMFKTGYTEGALENALAAEKLKDDSYLTAGLLGDIYAAQNDAEKAKEYYLKAAGLSEKYSAYYKGRLAAMDRTTKKR